MPQLATVFMDSMDKVTPWNEYPRPSLVRDSFFCLNGHWDFALTDGDAPVNYPEKIFSHWGAESVCQAVCREPGPGVGERSAHIRQGSVCGGSRRLQTAAWETGEQTIG